MSQDAAAAKAQAAKAQQKRREAEEKKLKADAAAKAQASASASAQASATDTEGPIPAPPSRGTRRPPPTKPLPIPGQKKITDQQAASQAPKNTQAAAAVEGTAAGATETPTPLNTSQASLVNSGSSVSSPLTRAHATSEASRARKVLEKAENKLKAVQNEVNRERTTSEKQRTQEELQDFIKRSKPFVSMLVTLLQKYSHNGALAEAGLTWRDFPPMKLFEVAEKRNVPSEQWSEWIWDYVNDRLHTERRRKKFSRFPGDVSSGRGVLDLQYKQVTTTLMEALSEYLIGHYKTKIDQILRGGTTLKLLSDT